MNIEVDRGTIGKAVTRARRCGFGPEALSALDRIVDEVSCQLAADGMPATRGRLAGKLIALACHGRHDGQVKELLLRALRNEALAASHAEHVPARPWSAA